MKYKVPPVTGLAAAAFALAPVATTPTARIAAVAVATRRRDVKRDISPPI
jgi:hypothetical protein